MKQESMSKEYKELLAKYSDSRRSEKESDQPLVPKRPYLRCSWMLIGSSGTNWNHMRENRKMRIQLTVGRVLKAGSRNMVFWGGEEEKNDMY